MFLLNSRLLLVIATCDPVKDHRHPLYQRYGAIVAEFPKLGCPSTSSPSQRGAPVSVLSTNIRNPLKNHFHCLQESTKLPIREALLLSFDSLLDESPQILVADLRSPIPKCLIFYLCHHMYSHGIGILTDFPFPKFS